MFDYFGKLGRRADNEVHINRLDGTFDHPTSIATHKHNDTRDILLLLLVTIE